jgi:hypothetical protein
VANVQCRSAAKAAVIEKIFFFRCRGAAEQLIAVWKAAEAPDYIGV